jgi:hypothetical protein
MDALRGHRPIASQFRVRFVGFQRKVVNLSPECHLVVWVEGETRSRLAERLDRERELQIGARGWSGDLSWW